MGDIKKYKGVTFVSLTSQGVSSIQNIKYIKKKFKTKPPMHWEYCDADLALFLFKFSNDGCLAHFVWYFPSHSTEFQYFMFRATSSSPCNKIGLQMGLGCTQYWFDNT